MKTRVLVVWKLQPISQTHFSAQLIRNGEDKHGHVTNCRASRD